MKIQAWARYITENGAEVSVNYCLGTGEPFPFRGVLVADRRRAFCWDEDGNCDGDSKWRIVRKFGEPRQEVKETKEDGR